MRSTGIVRRIDELGRVVIPKEIRRTMRIREGEELEVFTTDDDSLILKKFSAVREFASFADEYASSVYRTTGFTAAIADNDRIVAISGDIKIFKKGDSFSYKGERLKETRKSGIYNGADVVSVFGEDGGKVRGLAYAPIISGGDVMGLVALFSERELGDTALKTAETAAEFLSTQL